MTEKKEEKKLSPYIVIKMLDGTKSQIGYPSIKERDKDYGVLKKAMLKGNHAIEGPNMIMNMRNVVRIEKEDRTT